MGRLEQLITVPGHAIALPFMPGNKEALTLAPKNITTQCQFGHLTLALPGPAAGVSRSLAVPVA